MQRKHRPNRTCLALIVELNQNVQEIFFPIPHIFITFIPLIESVFFCHPITSYNHRWDSSRFLQRLWVIRLHRSSLPQTTLTRLCMRSGCTNCNGPHWFVLLLRPEFGTFPLPNQVRSRVLLPPPIVSASKHRALTLPHPQPHSPATYGQGQLS